MAYEGSRTRYTFTATDIGAGTKTKYIKGPKGKGGILVDYGIMDVTTTFTNVSTGATIQVGKSGTLGAYGTALDLGTVAATDGVKSVLTTVTPAETTYATYMANRSLPADTVLYVTGTAPTGGSPAGVGKMFVDIIWDE